MTLSSVASSLREPSDITKLGSMLFLRSVCGARVVYPGQKTCIEGYEFDGIVALNGEYSCSMRIPVVALTS